MFELNKLPKDSSAVRKRNRCQLDGRPRGYMREFGISRVKFRQLAGAGLIPGVKIILVINQRKEDLNRCI